MGGRTRAVIGLLGAITAGMALMFVIPALGATHEDAVRLHLGTDAQRFIYQIPDPDIVQPLAVGNKACDLKTGLTGPLVSLTSTGGGTKVGLVDLALGVKSGGSNGTPCSQIDSAETLIITNTYNRLWRKLRFDLELKGNARTLVTLKRSGTKVGPTFVLLTGTSIPSGESPLAGFPYKALSTPTDPVTACANPSDSGPDSGGNDNCLWTIESGFDFDRVEITTSVGTASLEGSEDFNNNPDHDSLFYFNSAPIANDTTFATAEEVPLNILPSQVGSDPEGDALLIDVVGGPAQGTATENANGSVTYTPSTDFFGTDTFTFKVCETGNPTSCSSTKTITVNVSNVNDAPVANADAYETNEFDTGTGSAVTLNVSATDGVLANDTDLKDPGDILTVVGLDTTGTIGTVSLSGDGSFTYTPDDDHVWPDGIFSYDDTFTYKAKDDGAPPLESSPAIVTITVYRVICSGEEVSATDAFVSGRFQRLTDPNLCKRYLLTASDDAGEVIFEPEGSGSVYYRGFLTFADDPGATPGGVTGTFAIGLVYDPDGPVGTEGYRALLGCLTPEFDSSGNVLAPGDGTTEIPPGETWCIASFRGVATSSGDYAIEWQVVGKGDPGFRTG